MAETLTRFYEMVERHGGLASKLRLAMVTGMPALLAAAEPDSPDVVARFREAVREITGRDPPVP